MIGVVRSPRYALLEPARCLWLGRGDDAVALLDGLAERLPPAVEPVRLRHLATGHQSAGRTEQAACRTEAARRAARRAGDAEEEVRAKALLGRIYAHSSAQEELEVAVALLKQCAQACDEGIVVDELFHIGCLLDLAFALGRRSGSPPARAVLERAIALSARFRDPLALADLYNGLAVAHLNRGDEQAAITYKQKSIQVYEELALFGRITAAFDQLMAVSGERAGGPAAKL